MNAVSYSGSSQLTQKHAKFHVIGLPSLRILLLGILRPNTCSFFISSGWLENTWESSTASNHSFFQKLIRVVYSTFKSKARYLLCSHLCCVISSCESWISYDTPDTKKGVFLAGIQNTPESVASVTDLDIRDVALVKWLQFWVCGVQQEHILDIWVEEAKIMQVPWGTVTEMKYRAS